MKRLTGFVLLVGALTLVPVYTFAAENCSTTTVSSGEQIKQVARDSDQRSSMSF
jgi:hypothetical protein